MYNIRKRIAKKITFQQISPPPSPPGSCNVNKLCMRSNNSANDSGDCLEDEIKIKVVRVFPLCYSHSTLQLCLEISISSNSCNLLCISSNSRNLLCISTVQLLYTVKGKGGNLIENHTSFPMV
jgi:hypothetical protein